MDLLSKIKNLIFITFLMFINLISIILLSFIFDRKI